MNDSSIRSVTVDNFDPNNPFESLNGTTLPKPVFGGCYPTPAEALRVGSGGAISLPDNAPHAEIDRAIREYELSTLALAQQSTSTTRSPALIARGYPNQNWGGTFWSYWDPAGLGCTPAGSQRFDFWSYSASGFPNDEMESITAYTGCDAIYIYEHINLGGEWLRIDNWAASLYDPYTGVNLNNEVSSSVHID